MSTRAQSKPVSRNNVAKGSGQMIRVTDLTVETVEQLAARHATARNLLIERIAVWVSELEHEGQQLVLGTLSPDRVSQVAAKIASKYKAAS